MLNLPLLIVLLFPSTLLLRAQDPVITTDSAVNSTQLQQWLHSGSPRLIAWAGYFARETGDSATLAEMPKLLENWPAPPLLNLSARHESAAAQRSLLDALIQRNADVSLAIVSSIAHDYPVQAAILVSRFPLNQSSSLLEQRFHSGGDTWEARSFVRIAAMMLAKSPPAGFVANIVDASEENLTISVRTESGGSGSSSGGGCGDGIGASPSNGWPPTFTYNLEENNPNSPGATLVQLDNDRITYDRHSAEGGWGSCHDVQPLNAKTRHGLIAHWLGVDPKEMPWQPEQTQTIVWTSQQQYLHDLGVEIDAQRALLHTTVESLRSVNLLTDNEAATVQPRLSVRVQCDAKPCPLSAPINSTP